MSIKKCSKNFSLLILLFILSACSSMRPPAEDNSDDAKRKLKTARVNIQLGIAYLERQNTQRAKQKLLAALDEAPHIPETWYSMAYFLEMTGNTKQAKAYYLKSIDLAPSRGDVQNNYGTYLCRSGNYRASIHHFILAVKDINYLNPADAYENAGLCAMKIPNHTLATRYFKLALLQNASRPISLIELAELYYKKNNYAAAKIKLHQFLALSPPNRQSLLLSNRLAVRSKMQKQFENSVRVFADKPFFIAEKHKSMIVTAFNHPNHITKKPSLKIKHIAPAKRWYAAETVRANHLYSKKTLYQNKFITAHLSHKKTTLVKNVKRRGIGEFYGAREIT